MGISDTTHRSTPGFAKHLLLGRFPKRKAVHSDVDAAVEADDEELHNMVGITREGG